MEARPIPAFYCCYLLRSRPSPAALYVGSTPNPPRRLKQHNGKGGAVRTRRERFRPWQMDCIVTGFPSKIAALQFEWAWQNTHLTKRIPAGQRITKVPKPKIGRNGKEKIPRPQPRLKDKLQNLHLLLRVPSFARWPLNVRFFCENLWEEWRHASESLKITGTIRSGINIVLDLKEAGVAADLSKDPSSTHEKGKRRQDAVGKGGVDGVDVGYGSMKEHLEKSMSLFGGDQEIKCTVCALGVTNPGHMAVTCPNGTCVAVSHLTCLAKRFLTEEEAHGSLLPTSGPCPKCSMSTQWSDLIKEMSLRARGQKEMAQLMKQPIGKRFQTPKASILAMPNVEADNLDEVEADEVLDDPLPEDWLPQEDDGDDAMSVASTASEAPSPINPYTKRLPSVIEDSEWDGAEVLG